MFRQETGKVGSGIDNRAPPGGNDGLQPLDWRDLSAPLAPLPGDNTTASRPRTSADLLYRHARPASLREEHVRAHAVARETKAAIGAVFAGVGDSAKVEIASLTPLVGAIAASISRNRTAMPSITRLKNRHEYTYIHSVSVCGLMIALGYELGFKGAVINQIGMAGLLHDIGKARVPRLLLDKPGALTAAETAVIRTHPGRGHEILIRSGGISEIVLDVCLHHHERIDGSGYPFGLTGDELSVHARMATICDVYDAVTSIRAYKTNWSPAEALEWMNASRGFFDEKILHVFTAMMGAFPAGSLVRLQSDRLGIVLDEAGSDPLAPAVAAFFCAATRRPIKPCRCGPESDPIAGVERPERWNFPDWNDLRAGILRTFASAT